MTYDSDPDFDTSFDSKPAARERSKQSDVAATIGLLVTAIIVGLVLSFVVALQLMGVDSCSGQPAECDFELLGMTTFITPVAILLVLASTVAGLIVHAKRSLRSWWIPALGIVLIVLAFVAASVLVDVGLNSQSHQARASA